MKVKGGEGGGLRDISLLSMLQTNLSEQMPFSAFCPPTTKRAADKTRGGKASALAGYIT